MLICTWKKLYVYLKKLALSAVCIEWFAVEENFWEIVVYLRNFGIHIKATRVFETCRLRKELKEIII
jgi:hypothetical protein